MKPLSVVLTLLVLASFGLTGCTDNTEPIVGPDEEAIMQPRDGSSLGKATVEHVMATQPIEEDYFIVCLGENVHFTGTLDIMYQRITHGNGDRTVQHVHYRMRMTGVTESGLVYRRSEILNYPHTNGDHYTHVLIAKFQGPPGAPDLFYRVHYHTTVTPNGDVTAHFDHTSGGCR